MRIKLFCLMQLEMKQLHIWLVHDTFTQLLSPLRLPFCVSGSAFTFILLMTPSSSQVDFHLLRGISRYCCRFAHDHRDCYSHRPLLPICEDPLDPALSREVVICVVSFKSRGLFSSSSPNRSRGCICSMLQLEPSFTLWWAHTHIED